MMGNLEDEITHGLHRFTRVSRFPIAFSLALVQLGPDSFHEYASILLEGPLLAESKGSNGRQRLLDSQGRGADCQKKLLSECWKIPTPI